MVEANGTAADGQPPAAPGAPVEPAGDAAAPKKRSRWGTKTETRSEFAISKCRSGIPESKAPLKQRKDLVKVLV